MGIVRARAWNSPCRNSLLRVFLRGPKTSELTLPAAGAWLSGGAFWHLRAVQTASGSLVHGIVSSAPQSSHHFGKGPDGRLAKRSPACRLRLADALLRHRDPGGIAASSAKPSGQQVVELRIEGNEHFPVEKIVRYIHTRAGRPYDPDVVAEDVRRLMHTRMFVDVQPFTQPAAAGVAVVFRVRERKVLEYVKFVGNEKIDRKVLAKEVGLKKDDPFDRYAVTDGPAQARGVLQLQGLPQGPHRHPRGREGRRPRRDLRDRRGAQGPAPLDELRRQHLRQRRPPADLHQVQTGHLVGLRRQRGSEASRGRQEPPDGLLPLHGLLPGRRRAVPRVQRGRELAAS